MVRRITLDPAGAAKHRPLVIVHPLPGSSALLDTQMKRLAARSGREILAMDLPGHGESIADPSFPQTIAGLSKVLLEALSALGISHASLLGVETGAAVAIEAYLNERDRFDGLILDAPASLPADQRSSLTNQWLARLGPLEPCDDGSHLLRLWHMRRDMALWWPWFDRRRECTRIDPLAIDPQAMTLEFREMVKQPRHAGSALHAALDYPMVERLRALGTQVKVLARRDSPWAPCLGTAASASGGAALMIEADSTAHDNALLDLLGHG